MNESQCRGWAELNFAIILGNAVSLCENRTSTLQLRVRGPNRNLTLHDMVARGRQPCLDSVQSSCPRTPPEIFCSIY